MSAQLNFQSAAYLNLAFVFLGAFFGSLSCILCGKIFKKKYFAFRLSLCFLLLAAAIAFCALFALNEKARLSGDFLSFASQGAFFAVLYFAAGFLCAASLKIVFPIAALIYVAWTLSLGIFLYKKIPLAQKYTLTVSESFVRDDLGGVEWKFAPSGEGAFVDFAVYELDKNALLPLPHYWHAMTGARAAPSQNAEAPDVLAALLKADDGTNGGRKNFLSVLLGNAAKKLLGKPSVRSVFIPKQALYPVIFEVKVSSDGGKFSAKLEKIM